MCYILVMSSRYIPGVVIGMILIALMPPFYIFIITLRKRIDNHKVAISYNVLWFLLITLIVKTCIFSLAWNVVVSLVSYWLFNQITIFSTVSEQILTVTVFVFGCSVMVLLLCGRIKMVVSTVPTPVQKLSPPPENAGRNAESGEKQSDEIDDKQN